MAKLAVNTMKYHGNERLPTFDLIT